MPEPWRSSGSGESTGGSLQGGHRARAPRCRRRTRGRPPLSVETGESFDVRAQYLIGADGVRGATRDLLGIGVEGPGAVGDSVSILVDAPLRDLVAARSSVIYGVRRPRAGCGFSRRRQRPPSGAAPADGGSILDSFGASFVVLADAAHPHRSDIEALALDVPDDDAAAARPQLGRHVRGHASRHRGGPTRRIRLVPRPFDERSRGCHQGRSCCIRLPHRRPSAAVIHRKPAGLDLCHPVPPPTVPVHDRGSR
jgi:hypothetical protein